VRNEDKEGFRISWRVVKKIKSHRFRVVYVQEPALTPKQLSDRIDGTNFIRTTAQGGEDGKIKKRSSQVGLETDLEKM